MTAIPEDILATARDCHANLWANEYAASRTAVQRDDDILEIARALLAERQRCAEIARDYEHHGAPVPADGFESAYYAGASDACIGIYHAILNPHSARPSHALEAGTATVPPAVPAPHSSEAE